MKERKIQQTKDITYHMHETIENSAVQFNKKATNVVAK
jgi:hypothetical protein